MYSLDVALGRALAYTLCVYSTTCTCEHGCSEVIAGIYVGHTSVKGGRSACVVVTDALLGAANPIPWSHYNHVL